MSYIRDQDSKSECSSNTRRSYIVSDGLVSAVTESPPLNPTTQSSHKSVLIKGDEIRSLPRIYQCPIAYDTLDGSSFRALVTMF